MFFRKKEPMQREKNRVDIKYQEILSQGAILAKQIDELFLGERDHIYREHFRPLCEQAAQYFFDLPASEMHHHSSETGLYLHSLETVLSSLTKFAQLRVSEEHNGYVDPVQTKKMREKWQLGTAIAALFHDAGKLMDIEVKLHNEKWNQAAISLYGFLKPHGICNYTFSWRTGRRPEEHRTFSGFSISRLLPAKELDFITLRVFWHVLDSLSANPSPENRIFPLIRESDALSASKGFTQNTTEERKRDKVNAFCDALKALCTGSRSTFRLPNTPGSRLWVGSEYTALVCPDGVREVCAYLREEGTRMPADTKVVYAILDERGILRRCGTSGQNVHKIFLKLPERVRPIALNVILLRNSAVWPDRPPEVFRGEYCFAGPDEEYEWIKGVTPNPMLTKPDGQNQT